jgi:hypothetical protein
MANIEGTKPISYGTGKNFVECFINHQDEWNRDPFAMPDAGKLASTCGGVSSEFRPNNKELA